MPDYSRCKIYKLESPSGHYYIGSTTYRQLNQRLAVHRCDSRRPKNCNNKLYSHITAIGWDKIKMTLLEEFVCANGDELRQRENRYIMESLDDDLCLNRNRAYANGVDYRDEKITCDCGTTVSRRQYPQHLQTNKHRKRAPPVEPTLPEISPA
jgi:hypothetical protein